MTYTMNQKQIDAFYSNMVEAFSGKEFTIDDIKGISSFKKQKKQKKVKDPNAPKRSCSSWIFFTMEMRPKVKEENPDKKTTELTTIMSEMWRDYSDEQKKPYKLLEQNDKERFSKAKEAYESDQSDSDSEEKKEKKVKKVKDPDAPKKNMNNYMHFCKLTRSKDEDVKYTAAALKVMWCDLDDKSEFTDIAAKDKDRYIKEKGEYDSKN